MEVLLNSLSSQGPLGLLLAISLLTVGYLFILLIREKDKRLQDQLTAKQDAINARDSIAEPLRIIKEYTILTYDKLKGEKDK